MTNDRRPNSGLREGDISHAEVNAALLSYEKTVIFGQQNRLHNGVLITRGGVDSGAETPCCARG